MFIKVDMQRPFYLSTIVGGDKNGIMSRMAARLAPDRVNTLPICDPIIDTIIDIGRSAFIQGPKSRLRKPVDTSCGATAI